MALDVGDVLEGKYRIERVLGRGGMGTVYEGVHTRIHRRVAIKVLKGALAANDEMVKRFEREALAASTVKSNHVVEVFDVGQMPDGERYMILEYLDGESLSARLKRLKTMAPNQIFPLAVEMLEGLDAAHAAGIVHRDLKPANIFIAKDDSGSECVKVLDFGVSKFADLTDTVTQTGAVVGTPFYMAPEQTRGARNAGVRSDIYAVGAILFRALTGRPPFVAETIHELIAKLISTTPPKVTDVAPTVDPAASAIVDRALEQDPKARYQSAREMIEALVAWHGRPSASVAGAIAAPAADEAPTVATPASSLHRLDSATSLGTPPPAVAGSADQLTPSPATLDSQATPSRPRFRLWVGAALAALVAAGIAVVTFTGRAPDAAEPAAGASPVDDQPDPSPAADEQEDSVQTPSEAEVHDDAKPPDETPNAPEPNDAKAAPTTSAAASPAIPRPRPRPRPETTPKPAPPPPPENDGRDFREDI